jgi:hypothetical protein
VWRTDEMRPSLHKLIEQAGGADRFAKFSENA